MPRAANANGSRGRRKDGLYWGAFTTPTGTRKYVYSRDQAERDRLMDQLRARLDGSPIEAQNWTVAQFIDYWLTHVEARVRPSTLTNYTFYLRRHVVPVLGKIKLRRLRPAHVQALVDAKTRELKTPRSVWLMRAILRAALTDAERLEMIPNNPAKLVSMPRDSKKRIVPLTAEQTLVLIEGSYKVPLGTLYITMLGLGIRLGEALGLTWDRVDFGASTVRIDRQLQRVDGVYALVPPKTERSQRVLAIPALVEEALRRRRIDQENETANDLGLVFTPVNGKPLDGTLMNHRFHRLLDDLGLPSQRLHDLRHLGASLMISQGASLKDVSETLGHSQIGITANLYAHLYDGAKREAANRLDAALGYSPRSP